jgi:AraC-like DNA-binding protein
MGKSSFSCHWHEKIEFLFFTMGECMVKCNSAEFTVKAGDLVVVNSNELHQARCLSDTAEYYCIIVDTSLLQNRYIDICEAKYIKPIYHNQILFKNKIENSKEASQYILEFVKEYESKMAGYEMAIKACIYQLLVFLLRNHVQLVLTSEEYNTRMHTLKRFNNIIEYIENNFKNKITLEQLCSMAHISRFHFCHIFKDITGKPLSEYLNLLRINKAETMLKESELNITEVAAACGFDDANYFSRLFKKYKKVSPSFVLKNKRASNS